MSLLDSTERRRRRSLTMLALLLGCALVVLVDVAALAVALVRGDDPTAAAPVPTDNPEPTSATSSTSPAHGAIRLVDAAATTAGVGTNWPRSVRGGVSAAADYTTLSTIEPGLLTRRLSVAYVDRPSTAGEVEQIVEDARRGRANLGVPPGRSAGPAQVRLEPEAAAYRAIGGGAVEGYVLVRRELVSYAGDRLPPDLLPVPFVVRRVGEDWLLTAGTVAWSPPTVSAAGAGMGGGWRALLPPG